MITKQRKTAEWLAHRYGILASRLCITLCLLFVVLCIQAQSAAREPLAQLRWMPSDSQDTTITVWKGERIGLEGYFRLNEISDELHKQLLYDGLWDEPMTVSCRAKKKITAETGILGAVLTDEGKHCGPHDMTLPTHLVWDVIDSDSLWTVPVQMTDSDTLGQVPFYCAVEVPRNIPTGKHYVEVRLVGASSRNVYGYTGLYLNVLPHALPAPHDYHFHTDFWQQPYSISRYYGVERWSREHMDLLRPYMTRLARAGQKCISAILFYEPWGDQTLDKFTPMVETTLRADTTWAYDYTIFDRWVQLMHECGIDRQINCYSMVPWDMNFRYWDEARGEYAFLQTTTADSAYVNLWTDFLQNFAQHLRDKGWFEKTCIAMDERGMEDMMRAYRIAQKAVPGIKMALAGNFHPELASLLHDYSIAYGQQFPADILAQRQARGQHSTIYTSCAGPVPNVFSNSHPLEATYLPLYAVANGMDGYLHWSWINWPENPLHDSRYRLFSPGDTYMIYPSNHSSVRWEHFLMGVQMAEKIRIVRADLQKRISMASSQTKKHVGTSAVAPADSTMKTALSADTISADSLSASAVADTVSHEEQLAKIASLQESLDRVNAALSLFADGQGLAPEELHQKIEGLKSALSMAGY